MGIRYCFSISFNELWAQSLTLSMKNGYVSVMSQIFFGTSKWFLTQMPVVYKMATPSLISDSVALTICSTTEAQTKFRPVFMEQIINLLFSCARDQCGSFDENRTKSRDVVVLMFGAANRCYPMSVVSEVYQYFMPLIIVRRKDSESFKTFQTCFDALFCKSGFHSGEIYFPEALLALQLLSAGNIDDMRLASFCAASVSK